MPPCRQLVFSPTVRSLKVEMDAAMLPQSRIITVTYTGKTGRRMVRPGECLTILKKHRASETKIQRRRRQVGSRVTVPYRQQKMTRDIATVLEDVAYLISFKELTPARAGARAGSSLANQTGARLQPPKHETEISCHCHPESGDGGEVRIPL